MQNWYNNVFVDAIVPFQLPYKLIWTALSNIGYTGFEPELLAWNPINMKLDMCDANVQKHQFSNLPSF